jgi:hypothetical protein
MKSQGFLLATRKRKYEIDLNNNMLRDGWVADILDVQAGEICQRNAVNCNNNNDNNKHSHGGQLNSFTHLKALLVLYDREILGPVS